MTEKLKIAFVLRGEPRHVAIGGKLFQRLVRKELGDGYDVRTFATLWSSTNRGMTDAEYKPNSAIYYHAHTIGDTDIIRELSEWNIERYDIIHKKEFLDIIKPHVREVYNKDGDDLNEDGIHPRHNFKYKRDCLLLHYIQGQMYCAGRAIDNLNAYVSETGWTPDLVVLTRTDICVTFTPEYVESIMNDIRNVVMLDHSGECNSLIISTNVRCSNQKCWTTDLLFNMTYDSAKNGFADIGDMFDHMFRTCPAWLGKYDANIHNPHFAWGQLLYKSQFIQQSMSNVTNFILRPIPTLKQLTDNIITSTNSADMINRIMTLDKSINTQFTKNKFVPDVSESELNEAYAFINGS